MKYSEKLDCDMVNLTKTWLFFKANRTAINDKIYSYNTTIIPYQNQRSNRSMTSLLSMVTSIGMVFSFFLYPASFLGNKKYLSHMCQFPSMSGAAHMR